MQRLALAMFLSLTFFSCTKKIYESAKIDKITAYKFKTTGNSDTTLYRVSFSVKANKKTDSLYIPEYGSLKSDSVISFSTGQKSFTLYEKNRNLKKTFQLNDITYLQGADDLTLATEKDFDPKQTRIEPITNDAAFEDHVREELYQYFPLGFPPPQVMQDRKIVITTPFYDLQLPPSTTKYGQIAFMITYRFIEGNRQMYHITTTIRQRRRGERTWTPVDDNVIIKKSSEVVNELIQNLNK